MSNRSLRGSWWVVLVLGACRPAPAALPDDAAGVLVQAAAADDTLVYDGVVRDLDDPAGAPLYRYERRVHHDGALQVSSHVTYAPGDPRALIAMTATHGGDYGLVRLDTIDRQRGLVAEVRMLDGHRVGFRRTRAGRTRERIESVRAPVVTGPTLFGWTLAHWDSLMRGEVIAVRFAAAELGRTFGFELRVAGSDAATTTIAFTATSPVVRAAVPPMRMVFDTASRKIVRYEGRVPPMNAEGKALDARVEYTFVAEAYE